MDKLRLNDDKTELMIIGSRQQLEKVSCRIVWLVTPALLLLVLQGSWFDPNLKFDAQITKICCTGYFYLHIIRKFRKYLTLDSTRCLLHALVMGRVDFIL